MSKFKDPFKGIRLSDALTRDPLKEHREMIERITNPMGGVQASIDAFRDPLKEHRELMERISDPLKDINASFARIKDPLEEQRELMSSLNDPMGEMRTTMGAISDPLNEHREMMESISDPMKDIRASMTLLSDPLKEHREMMKSLSNPIEDLQASLNNMTDPLKKQRELIASLTDPMKSLQSSLNLHSNTLSSVRETIANSLSLKYLRDTALEVQSQIDIDSAGQVTLSSKNMSTAILQELSDQILRNSSQAQSHSLEESINNLAEEIRAQKDPLTQNILIYFLYPLIIILIASVINPIADYNIKQYLNSDKRALKKEIKENVSSVVDDKELLSSLRYVSADILNVRANSSTKSEIIGKLNFSSTVLVLDKQKNWTLIEWNDRNTDAQIIGWVFSRYLEKFR